MIKGLFLGGYVVKVHTAWSWLPLKKLILELVNAGLVGLPISSILARPSEKRSQDMGIALIFLYIHL